MSGPLDILREAVRSRHPIIAVDIDGEDVEWDPNPALEEIDAFEQAHPGLVDRTAICICCGVAHDPFTQWSDETLNRFAFCAECADRDLTSDPCPKCGAKS
jgi:hypothetical protein